MKSALRLLTTTALLAVSACAAPLYTNVYPGNDQPGSADFLDMLADLEAFDPLNFDASQLSFLTKFDPVVNGAVQSNVTIVTTTTNGDGEVIGGTWSSTVAIALITIKAADEFKALYYGIPGQFSGTWDTSGIGKDKHEVSHISVFTHPGLPDDDTTVPEPSTWLMMSAGVAALAGRRFFRS